MGYESHSIYVKKFDFQSLTQITPFKRIYFDRKTEGLIFEESCFTIKNVKSCPVRVWSRNLTRPAISTLSSSSFNLKICRIQILIDGYNREDHVYLKVRICSHFKIITLSASNLVRSARHVKILNKLVQN